MLSLWVKRQLSAACNLCMDVLKNLFEQHFHTPVERVQPLAGAAWRFGTQHHPAGRWKDQRDRHSLRRARRERRLSGIFPAFSPPWPACARKSMPKIWIRAPISKKTSATRRCSSFSRRIAPAKHFAPQVVEAYRKVVAVLPRFQIEAGRDLNYKRLLSARQLRSPVHRLGPELFQILLSAARRHSVQRAGAGRRFRAA